MYVYVVRVCVVFLCSPLLQEAVSIARCVCVCVCVCVCCVLCVYVLCVCVCGLSLPPFAARKLFQYPGVCVRCMVCVCVCVCGLALPAFAAGSCFSSQATDVLGVGDHSRAAQRPHHSATLLKRVSLGLTSLPLASPPQPTPRLNTRQRGTPSTSGHKT